MQLTRDAIYGDAGCATDGEGFVRVDEGWDGGDAVRSVLVVGDGSGDVSGGTGSVRTSIEMFFACFIADLIRVKIASIFTCRMQQSTTSTRVWLGRETKRLGGGDRGGFVGGECERWMWETEVVCSFA